MEAEELIELGKLDDAIDLCRLGVAEYPDYFAGYSVLLKALALAGKSDTATDFINQAKQNLPKTDKLETITVESVAIEFHAEENSSVDIEQSDLLVEEINDDFDTLDDETSTLSEFTLGEEEIVGIETFESDESLIETAEDDFSLYADSNNLNIILENQEIQNLDDDENDLFESDDFVEIIETNADDSGQISYIEQETKELSKGFLMNVLVRPTVDSATLLNPQDPSLIPGLLEYLYHDKLVEQPNLDSIFEPATKFDINSIKEKYTAKLPQKDDFTELASKISMIKIKPVPLDYDDFDESESQEEEVNAEPPATETMAKILTMQKSYDKAINVYRRLADANPEKSEQYNQIINELEAKLSLSD